MIDGAARPERIGICIDTCHLFAAGYDLRTETGYARAIAECEATVGRRRVLAFHLNDAKAPFGSGLDRHEHIGRGFLGLAAFRRLLNDRRFARVPKYWRPRRNRSPPLISATSPHSDGCVVPAAGRAPGGRTQRALVTPTFRQSEETGQIEQCGESGVQRF